MNYEKAQEISQMAAPIYAAFLTTTIPSNGKRLSVEELGELRTHAIAQASALWLDVLELPDC